jgi:hypothetical protein
MRAPFQRSSLACALLCLLAAGCEDDAAGDAVTQVVVDVDAEPSLQPQISELQLRVTGSDGKGELDRRLERLMQSVRPGQDGEPEWPVRIALVPREGDATRVFELSASAFDADGQLLTVARLITGYVEHQTRYARLMIQASCVGKTCLPLETCEQGTCIDAWRDPDSLVSFDGKPKTGLDAGDTVGPPTVTTDAGADAAIVGPGPGPALDAATDGGADAAIAADCEPDTTRCDDGGLFSCGDDGAWDDGVPCAYACIRGECTGECVPDSVGCLQGSIPRVCNDDAEWEDGAACPAVCIDGACAASCDEGVAQCSGQDLLTCGGDGAWSEPEPCEFLCDDETDACVGECIPDSQQCVGLELQVCGNDAQWDTVVTCPNRCEADPDEEGTFRCGGDCPPDSTRCDSVTELATCGDDAEWDDPVTCEDQACGGTPAACRGSCSPGTTQCADTSTLQRCNDSGSYEDTDCAEQDDTCVESGGGASCTGDCAPGQQQCSSNRVQSCNASGGWENAPGNCTISDQTCVEVGTTASCTGECAPGQTACIDGDAHACDDGDFSETDDCTPPGEICRSGACVANDPYPVGETTALPADGWVDFSPSNDTWYVVPITVTRTANVLALRVLVRAGVAGALARMALWEDDGGVPAAFVAQTDNISLSAAGAASDAPVPLATQVEPGTYWIGAKLSGGAALYRDSTSTVDGYFYSQAFATNPATSMAPFPIGSAGTLLNGNYNFYLVVQDVAQ